MYVDYQFHVELLTGSINSLVIQGEPVVFDQDMMDAQGVTAANACVSVSCENGGGISLFNSGREVSNY